MPAAAAPAVSVDVHVPAPRETVDELVRDDDGRVEKIVHREKRDGE
jgi:hypothetical protein